MLVDYLMITYHDVFFHIDCMIEPSNITAGRIDINNINNGQDRIVKEYLIHPDYRIGLDSRQNDICLLTLDHELEFNDTVKNIELNDENLTYLTRCTMSGWGADQVFS